MCYHYAHRSIFRLDDSVGVGPQTKHKQNTSKTHAQTQKHNVVSEHKTLGRPAPQTQNATKLKQTHPRHTDTQAKRIQTHSKHTKTQPKHSQTQIGARKKSAEGEGAKHTPKHKPHTARHRLAKHSQTQTQCFGPLSRSGALCVAVGQLRPTLPVITHVLKH